MEVSSFHRPGPLRPACALCGQVLARGLWIHRASQPPPRLGPGGARETAPLCCRHLPPAAIFLPLPRRVRAAAIRRLWQEIDARHARHAAATAPHESSG